MPSQMGPMPPVVVEHQQVDCLTRYQPSRLRQLLKEKLGQIAIALMPKIPKAQFYRRDYREVGLRELLPYTPAVLTSASSSEAPCAPLGYQG